MSRRIGVALSWKAVDLVLIERSGDSAKVLYEAHLPRGESESPAAALRRALAEVPTALRASSLAIALSYGDVACAASWPVPPGLTKRDAARAAAVDIEAASAGDTLEALACDVVFAEGRLRALGIRDDVLRELRGVTREAGASLEFVTGVPAALAAQIPDDLLLCRGREEMRVRRTDGIIDWRSYPVADGIPDRIEPSGVAFGGIAASAETAAALATALVEPDDVPDALRGSSEAPRTFGARFRKEFLSLGGAAAILLLGLGFFFRALEIRANRELTMTENYERGLLARHFPGKATKRGEFVRLVRGELKDAGNGDLRATWPSAFSFFAEIGRRLPEVELLGLTLEAVDLTPEGGRLAVLVPLVQGDPLRNAALLEKQLGDSPRLGARGDYETRGQEVQVRLKLDFQELRP